MPTLPGSRGSSARTAPRRVSWRRICGHRRSLPRPLTAATASCGQFRPSDVVECVTARRVRSAAVSSPEPRTHAPGGSSESAFRTLPERYLGAEPGFDATYHCALGDVGHTWEVRCTDARRAGAQGRDQPPARRRHRHRRRDLAAPARRRASRHRGLLASACSTRAATSTSRSASRGCSACQRPRPAAARPRRRAARAARVSTLTMGEGPDVLLLHGLGARQDLVLRHRGRALAAGYRVHALDLPGFGCSSKPAAAPYNARWFAETRARRDGRAGDRPRPPRRQLDGRPGGDRGRPAPRPSASSGLALLCPAVAFVKRGFHPIVRLLRPELGLLPHRFTRGMVASQFWSLFADPDRARPERRRHRRRRVPAHLRSAGRAPRLPLLGAQHLPRRPVRPRRLLPAPGRARGARRCSSGARTTR